MIAKIKNKIKEFENRIDINYQFNHDQLAITQLLKMFDNNVFLPLTTWSICPKEVLHICNDIIINNRKNIIEFGSGFSTLCIAQLLKINNIKANFISVENNEEWVDSINTILKQLDLNDYVKIVLAPIADVDIKLAKEGQKKWYDNKVLDESLVTLGLIDLIIVDGPYGGLTPYARYSAVPYLKEKMSDNFSIFLDDSRRKMEKEILNDWEKILKGNLSDFKRYACISSNSSFGSVPYGNR